MDIVELIRSAAGTFAGTPHEAGVRAVVRHIERAEMHFRRGREEADDDSFNDVVYRTNQAFEGILKEAYVVLTGKDASKLRPVDLESHYSTNNVLKPRVSELLTNYRRQWRNPATHDHSLFFTEQEALLALVSICAFVVVLLDQMVEAYAFTLQTTKTDPSKIDIVPKTNPLAMRIAEALERFPSIAATAPNTREVEVLGALHAFLRTVVPDAMTAAEAIFEHEGRHDQVDLTVQDDNSLVILEVKIGRGSARKEAGIAQLERYLQSSGAGTGILYLHPTSPEQKLVREERRVNIDGRDFQVFVVGPGQVSTTVRSDG